MNPKPEPINLGEISCPEIVPDIDALAEEKSLWTVLSDISGTVLFRIEEVDPAALDLLAGGVGVLADGPQCPTRTQNKAGVRRVCCRTKHADPWHVDGRWPTTPFRADEYGRFLGELSR